MDDREGRSESKRSRSPDLSNHEPAVNNGPHQIDHEFEEMKWGLNMALIGDGHWKSFHMVEDIKNMVNRMESKVNFRVMGKEGMYLHQHHCGPFVIVINVYVAGETLSRMYDDQRDSLISALPTRCYKVAISVGTFDLRDNSLITLKVRKTDQ